MQRATPKQQYFPVARQTDKFDEVGKVLLVDFALFVQSELGIGQLHRLHVVRSLELLLVGLAVREIELRYVRLLLLLLFRVMRMKMADFDLLHPVVGQLGAD